jgi:NAD-dependent deacetylase
VIVNRDPTPYDGLAIEVITEPIGTSVPRITAMLERAARS